MPVFGIVPYRTEARTRSEARIQAEVDRLLEVLRTVANVIRTALSTDRVLLDALPQMIHPSLRPRIEIYTSNYPSLPNRASDREWRTPAVRIFGQPDPDFLPPPWGWGTIQ